MVPGCAHAEQSPERQARGETSVVLCVLRASVVEPAWNMQRTIQPRRYRGHGDGVPGDLFRDWFSVSSVTLWWDEIGMWNGNAVHRSEFGPVHQVEEVMPDGVELAFGIAVVD